MAKPIRVPVERDEVALKGIKQFYVPTVEEDRKFDTLR